MCLEAWMQSVCMQASKVRQHQVAYSADDWYFD
jgi:hypothetical protein